MSDVGKSLIFGWIIDGEVAACRTPLWDTDLAFLRAQGVGSIVRIVHPDDIHLLMKRSQIEDAGLVDLLSRIKDYAGPSQRQIDRILRFICEQKSSGHAVAVSCVGGCGRTGMILACHLIARGYSAGEALEYILSKRPCSESVVHTPDQLAAIFSLERRARHRAVGTITADP